MATTSLHRLAAGAATLLTTAALTLVGSTSPALPAGPVTAPARAVACVDDHAGHDAARTRKNGSAKEPNAISAARAAALGNPKVRRTLAAGSVTIDTVVHVISAEPLTRAEIDRYNTMIAAQMDVLNDAYAGSGASAGSTDTPFRFDYEHTTFTVNEAWASLAYGSKETKAAKSALREGDASTLNVYVVDLGGGLLGYATFPQQGKGRLSQDGVVILDESMPGGDVAPYNRGDTLVHEVGHWLGLFHPFQGACDGPGDYVSDTPAEAAPAWDCTMLGRDSCPADAGTDPVQNFMDYADDECINEFTEGQGRRMSNSWEAFRQ